MLCLIFSHESIHIQCHDYSYENSKVSATIKHQFSSLGEYIQAVMGDVSHIESAHASKGLIGLRMGKKKKPEKKKMQARLFSCKKWACRLFFTLSPLSSVEKRYAQITRKTLQAGNKKSA